MAGSVQSFILRKSQRGIEKCIKKILNKIPADPFEAELLALAGDIAGGPDSSDSESEGEEVGPTDLQPITGPPLPDMDNLIGGTALLCHQQ